MSLSELQEFVWTKTNYDDDRSFDWDLEGYNLDFRLGVRKNGTPYTRFYSHNDKVWFDLCYENGKLIVKELDEEDK